MSQPDAREPRQDPPRTLVLQGGAYGEHRLESVTAGGRTTRVQAPLVTVRVDPGCGQRLVLQMRRYAHRPTALHPWHRQGTMKDEG